MLAFLLENVVFQDFASKGKCGQDCPERESWSEIFFLLSAFFTVDV